MLRELLLRDAVGPPQLFETTNQIFLCISHINSFAVYACGSHPTIGSFLLMNIKGMTRMTVLGGILALTGCVSSTPQTGCAPKQTWYQLGVSADQTRRDLADCQYQSMLNEKNTFVAGGTLGQTLFLSQIVESNQKNRQSQMIQVCMTAKGYALVNTNDSRLNGNPVTH